MSSTPSSFRFFTSLPAELRLEIWRESCTPRVVEVRYSEQQDRCLTATKPPAILQVCRESRDEGLRLYAKMFATKTRPGNIYFSATLDVLYLPRSGSMGYGDASREFAKYINETVDQVHSLAIDHVQPEVRRPWETYNKFCLMKNFPHLKEAFLVFSGSEERDASGQNGQIEFVDPRADRDNIMRLMDDVNESFYYEAGYDLRSGCIQGFQDAEECDDCVEPRLTLVPKTKAVWQPQSRPISVTCI